MPTVEETNAFAAPGIEKSDAEENHNDREDLTHIFPISLQTSGSASEDERPSPGDVDHLSDRNFSFASKSSAITTGLNRNLQRIRALLQTSVGQDSVLASVEYLAHALHYFILSRYWVRLRQTVTYLLCHRKGRDLQMIASRPTQSFVQKSQALLKLSSLFSDARFTLRSLGIFSIWANIPEIFRPPVKDRVILSIDIMQVFTITAYHFLENIGHLASNRVLSQRIVGPKKNIPKFYIWSARALCLHFVLELVKLTKEACYNGNSAQNEILASEDNTKPEDDDDDADSLQWEKRLWSTSIWGVLCLYWSSGKTIPIVEESSGGLSFLADFFTLRDAWAHTEK
ncbi:hypothetical protein N7478_005094 [Penicillium angulare]|uniref:uncharacterized protein n=1 Tax=Penicillium angulare TaxID=116970 RepID=UPI0025425A71|nr:uncharacterized protein N7478_005094 [Penicillium angulare]KAJ5279722.1 hypothetical protein N7478_005094 [Penicillium angulare]